MKKLLLILLILSSFYVKGDIHQIQVWNGYYQFLPSNNITVQLGDTVQWVQLDPPTMTHTITSDNIPNGAIPFDQIWQLPADTFFQYIPQVVGLYQYVCTPHIPNGMIGEFTVVNGPQTYVPDDNFENALINLGLDNILDNYVATASIDTVTILDVSSENIADLTGIEDFTALTYVVCESNNITSLDVSQNSNLTHLKTRYNQITSLDISNNIALTYLECDYNEITSLNVSNNIALTSLSCAANQLSILDVSNNTALIELDCYDNYITILDVSNNINLIAFQNRGNQLTSLNLSNNTALTEIDCSDNQLTSLDISSNILLEFLECSNNQIVNLDVSNNIVLQELWCYSNHITNLDVSNNIYLNQLSAESNPLISLNVQNGNNTNLYCDNVVPLCCGGIQIITSLSCIQVDDIVWAYLNWTTSIDTTFQYFSTNCSPVISIHEQTTNKEILKVTDILGREAKGTKNEVLFYLYDDGTVEKRIVVE